MGRAAIRKLVNITYNCSFSIEAPSLKVSLQALIQSGVHNISWKTPYSSKQTRWGLTKKEITTFVREQTFEIFRFFRRPTYIKTCSVIDFVIDLKVTHVI